MKKRLFGILLSLAMVVTMMPVLGLSQTAYATSDTNYVLKFYLNSETSPRGSKTTTLPCTLQKADWLVLAGLDPDSDYSSANVKPEDEDYLSLDDSKNLTIKEAFGGSKSIINIPPSNYTVSITCEVINYPIWVGDKQVNSANAGDILGDQTASYDAESNTLTLSGINMNREQNNIGTNTGISYDGTETLTIVLEGENIIDFDTVPGYGQTFGIISSNGTIIIKGTGSLTATGNEIGISSYQGDITIDGSDVTAIGGSRAIYGTVKNTNAGKGWTNEAGTEGEADIAAGTHTSESLSTYKKVHFLPSAEVTKAPEAKTLTYTGSAQELVTAGTAEGGKMQYAIGTDATTAPTTGWSTSIPTGTKAGTYYVWYKAAGDATHSDSEPKAVTVTIKGSDPAKESTITYDLNGGTLDGQTGLVTVKVANGTVITLPTPTRDGYTFDYWEGSKYNAGDKYTVNGDHTFKAVWKTAAGGDGSKGGSSKKGVNTGDENTLGAWIVLLAAALAGTTGMVFARKRKNN